MKNLSVFILLLLFYLFLNFILNNFVQTDTKIIDFLAKDYPSSVVQNYMESQKKWWWVSYAVTPLLIGIKVLLVAFCLNFVKIMDLENAAKIKFSDILFVVLIAEFVFVIAGLYKFINFYFIDTDYTLEDLQTYYPISLINLREYISTEKWLAYPLQLVNLFELFYWAVLVWGIKELFDNKISYKRSLGYVAATYGVGLLFWTGVVCFLILNAQY
ncbi:hypothetical protein MHJ94_07550 [Chryseobacterium taklimakanense]|uniref:hypothetical protein n=1 Tax=Chryseobacterium taklimakanense TaxID=536441 RepID=UPI001EF42459|nr:hypothetical protein [Chryseobacterium taklimakanense]MCG7281152.1 hypothetical protein [Chryseobacterium taklimakanense]